MQITIAAMQSVRKGLILIFKELKSKKVKRKWIVRGSRIKQ